MKIALASFDRLHITGVGSSPSLRLAPDMEFVNTERQSVAAGDYSRNYRTITPTLAGTTLTVPTVSDVDTTTDSSNPNATYSLWLVDSNGRNPQVIFERWAIPASFTSPISFTDLETYNVNRAPLRDDQAFSKTQTILEIESRLTVGNPASTTALGRVKMSVVPADAASPVAVGDNDPRVLSGVINVKASPYNAVGDNSTDDTAAIQAALSAAQSGSGRTVYFPKGTYKVTSTLRVGNGVSASFINLLGDGEISSRLSWAGSTSGVCLEFFLNKYFKMQGVGVTNNGAKGTTVGILLSGPNVGTQTLAGTFEHVSVSNFATGISAGVTATSIASSEIYYNHVQLEGNDVGWKNSAQNTLDHVFSMLLLNGNGTGVQGNVATIFVRGGSASNSTAADFHFTNGGTYTVSDFRSENTNRFLTTQTSGPVYITLTGNLVSNSSNADRVLLEMAMGSAAVTMIGNEIGGKVYVLGANDRGTLTMIGNGVQDTNPFTFSVVTGDADGLQYFLVNNHQLDVANINNMLGWFNDESGVVVWPNRKPLTRLTRNGTANTKQDIRGVEGVSGTLTQAKNLRGTATLTAGTASVTFAAAEPDTSYFIVLSGNAGESFSWASKTVNGFTVNSSNAGSTAVVDWILIR